MYKMDVMDNYDQDETQTVHKCNQAQRLPRGAASETFGNPAQLLDTAKHVQCGWNSIASTTNSKSRNNSNIRTR